MTGGHYSDVSTVLANGLIRASILKAAIEALDEQVYALTTGAAPGALWGLTLSNNASDPTNDIDIAAGAARDATNAVSMALASALTKRLDAAWTVGTNQGGLDTGSIANTTYHVWLIKRSDTGVVDVLFSASASAPTMPANYTYKRRIGSFVRTGGAIKAFVQVGDEFLWVTPVVDVDATNPGTSAVTRTLTLPTGIAVRALITVGAFDGTNDLNALFSPLSVTDQTPQAVTTAALTGFGTVASAGGSTSVWAFAPLTILTNTSAQIRSRLSASGAADHLGIITRGWIDTRGKDS